MVHPSAARSRQWLTAALWALMQEKPFARITISEIAERAQLSRRTFYRNFSSKEELLAAHLHALVLRHVHKVAPVVEHLATRRIEEAHKDLHQHSLACARLTDNEVGLAVVEDGVDVAQDGFIAKGLVYMLDFYHGFLLF